MKHPNYNRHHIVPVSKGWANVSENIIRLKTNVHAAIHLVFWNKTPIEQLEYLIEGYNSQVLRNKFKKDILDVIYSWDDGYHYKDWILVPDRIKD